MKYNEGDKVTAKLTKVDASQLNNGVIFPSARFPNRGPT